MYDRHMLHDPILDKFVRETMVQAYEFINPYLTNYEKFVQKMNKLVKIKSGANEQFQFDVALDELYLHGLAGLPARVRIFSEESSWSGPESADYYVVYDPLCNSSLASRTFLDAAMGMTFFDATKNWIASIILDYQTGILGVAQRDGSKFWQVPAFNSLEFDWAAPSDLGQAWVVLTLESVAERSRRHEADRVLDTAKRVLSSSGHLYWLRLAEGAIDAYADPFGGEELYEMFACMVAKHAGCVVTDLEGKPFDPNNMFRQFEADKHHRFYPVAARTPELHAQLLAALRPAS
jgi:hypothetical protein